MHALLSKVAHKASSKASWPGYYKLKKALKDVETAQRRILYDMLEKAETTEFGKKNKLSKSLSWEQLKNRLPVTNYSDWESWIRKQRKSENPILCGSPCNRFQPTSGSTSKN